MKTTDWNAYYSKPYKTATITRKITGSKLINILNWVQNQNNYPINLIELGGANSCFYEDIVNKVKPASYSILDNNQLGLEKFKERIGNHSGEMIKADVLNYKSDKIFDVVFSVGLIEHFNESDTKKSVQTHWNLVKNGGIMILFFPTPTFLYRITRKISELLGLWIFFDERPLSAQEILEKLPEDAQCINKFIIWPIFLTQQVLVIKKLNFLNKD